MTKTLRTAIQFGFGRENWDKTIDFIVEAEKLGVDYVWSAEAWGSDGISPLAFAAARTSKVKLGTAILQAGTRTPALIGMTCATMNALTGGRFILGLGTSGPQVIEGWHGIPFKMPVTRMREIVDIARIVQSGEKVSYDGKVYKLPLPGGEGKAIRSAMGATDSVPVYLATLSPKSLEMTGEIADGWLGTSFMPEHADVFFDHIRTGAQKAGRSMDEIDLQAGGTVAFSDDLESLIPPRKPGLAFTLGAMGSKQHNFYNAAFQRAGYQDIAQKAQQLWIDGDRPAAAALIPDEMVLQTNLLGTEAHVKDRIRAYRDAGVTTIRIDPDGEGIAARLDTLGRFLRLLGEVNAEVPVA
ncbi:MAG TPA: LLM class flavin-dependent oxidoreductase [Dehalococcoidia bacterium]|nr:LLM class flavin-dependent oxidoreductase [Dehalococcoidia bacterium]